MFSLPKSTFRHTRRILHPHPRHFTTKPTKTLSLPLHLTKPSATLAINELSAELKARNPIAPLFRFGLGQSPFPVPVSMQQALRDNAHQKDYLPCAGLRPLREAIADYLNDKMHQPRFDYTDILIGPGSKELLFHSQLALQRVLQLPLASWVSYEPQNTLIGKGRVHWARTRIENGFKIQPDDVEKSLGEVPRMLILNYPNNPTGATYSAQELENLSHAFRNRDAIVVSDEIYGEVDHRGNHVSLANYYPEGTIISSGISKGYGAGGWRLGYYAFPKELKWLQRAMEVIASETYTSVSAPIQYAAVKAFQKSEEMDRYLHDSRRILRAVAQYGYSRFTKAGATVVTPEGGFYLYIDLSETPRIKREQFQSGREMTLQLLKDTGVAVLPAEDFGFGPEEMAVRLAYVDFDGEKALQVVRNVETDDLSETFLREHLGHTIDGLDRFAEWMEG